MRSQRTNPDERRLLWLAGWVAVAGFVAFGRMAWVQAWHPDRYLNPTKIHYHRQYELTAEKGEMLDRRDRSLARCVEVASIAAQPQKLVDPQRAAKVLAPYLLVSEEELYRLLSKRWRPVMLRRDVTTAAAGQLKGLVESGAVRLTEELSEPTYSVYVFPRQCQPDPRERAALAIILGQEPAQLDALLGSPNEVVRWAENVDQQTYQRLSQLGLPGLMVQENPRRRVPTIWLQPVDAAVMVYPLDQLAPGTRGEDWGVRIRNEVWTGLQPLWAGAEPPDREAVEERLRAPFVYLARELPLATGDEVKQVVKQSGLTGITVHHEFARAYPQGEVGRTLLGKTDVDERGISGFEELFNQALTGVNGHRRVTVTRQGWPIVQEREERVEPLHGKTIELTVDIMIQGFCEEALAQTVAQFDADWGMAVVLDPFSGEVIALANVASQTRDVPDYNRCMLMLFEPGSVIKSLVAAAAIDRKLTNPRERFFCSGSAQVGRSTLHCIKVHGSETVADAIRDSCNSVMIHLGQRMGQETLDSAFTGFGLFERTGLGLPGQEAAGRVYSADGSLHGQWSIQKLATVSYGKGIQCTGVELARAYAALVNGGTLPELRLVRRILDRDGRVVVEPPVAPGREVLTQQTAAELREMLRTTVAEGTGRTARSDEFSFAGKTGTSLGYRDRDQRVVSFIGFGPTEHPRLLTLLSVGEPRLGERGGGSTCGAAFRSIMERSLKYLGLPPRNAGEEAGADG